MLLFKKIVCEIYVADCFERREVLITIEFAALNVSESSF